MILKSCRVYTTGDLITINFDQVNDAIADEHYCRDCPPDQEFTLGFVPVGHDMGYVLEAKEWRIMRYMKKKRVIPSDVLDKEYRRLLQKTGTTHKQLKGSERKIYKEQAKKNLLPKAFIKESDFMIMADTSKNRMYIGMAGDSDVSNCLTSLNLATDSQINVTLIKDGYDLISMMKEWLIDPLDIPEGVDLGKTCVLANDQKPPTKVQCTNIDVSSREVLAHLNNDLLPVQLQMISDSLVMTITSDFVFKGIGFTESYKKDLKEQVKSRGDDPQADKINIVTEAMLLGSGLREMTNIIINQG